jgi:hypothetical protein
LLSEKDAQIKMLRKKIQVLSLENNNLKIQNDKHVKTLEEIANIVY